MASPGIIPVPQTHRLKAGEFVFNPKTTIILQPDNQAMRNAVSLLKELFLSAADYELEIKTGKVSRNAVICQIDNKIAQIFRFSVTKILSGAHKQFGKRIPFSYRRQNSI